MLRVNNLIGFGVSGARDIVPTDDGDAAASSGLPGTIVTWTSASTTGPHSYALLTYDDGTDAITVSSATWGVEACSILEQAQPASGATTGAAILYCAGAQTGDLVITFSGDVPEAEITKVSLANVVDPDTPVDTDELTSTSATSFDLAALSSPGAGGIRLAVFAHRDDPNTVTWTNASEISDLDVGGYQHSAAYDLGDDATTINASISGANRGSLVGVSLR